MHAQDKVVHNYVDRAQEADPAPTGTAAHGGGASAGTTTGNPTVDHNFPMKLHYMLSNIESEHHIVSWQPHGRYVLHCIILKCIYIFQFGGSPAS